MMMEGAFITKVSNSGTEEGNVVQKVEFVFKTVTIEYKRFGVSLNVQPKPQAPQQSHPPQATIPVGEAQPVNGAPQPLLATARRPTPHRR